MAKSSKKSMAEEMMKDDQMSCCDDGACSNGCGCGMYYEMEKPRGKMFVAFSAGILFLLLSVWVGMQIWGNPWYKNIRAEFTAAPYSRTITVEGDGKVTVKPDLAMISLSVASVGKTVKEVTDDNNKKMTAIINAVKSLGVKSEDIMTTGYDLYPQYDYYTPVLDNKVPAVPQAPKILGYNLNQSVSIKIRDLSKSDDILQKGVDAGANQIGALSFDLDDSSNVKKEARKMAFDKARDKAEQMATAAGVKIGKVVTFSEGYNGGYMPQYANYAMKTMDSAEGSVAPSVEAGSKEFTVNVSVTYEIE
ncbi:SIMPL domain-containing protein [Candidatus Peregrinibacteria bacterium]|nr:SIMPL domain-containing protein [Candidatus Peregrinibacteria bacterium]